MAILQIIEVQQDKKELEKQLRRCSSAHKPRIKMLLLMLKGVITTKVLASRTGVSPNCISNWKQLYKSKGLKALVEENRGGHKQGAISREAYQHIEKRLADPKGGFTSYTEAMQWINESFGLCMKYHAVNKYLKYHFHLKFKVGRKTHVNKDPLAEQVFKK